MWEDEVLEELHKIRLAEKTSNKWKEISIAAT